jgi:carbon monoxide dehydrogenase subunit G
MQRHEASIAIGRPAAEIFPWLHEPDKRLQWVQGLRASAPAGERRFRETMEQAGQRIQAESQIVRLEPPTELEVRTRAKGITGTLRFRLHEEGGRTRVDVTVETSGSGLAGRVLEGIVARHAAGSLDASLQELQRRLEREL